MATFPPKTTSPVPAIPWQMTALAFGTYLTLRCFPISICITHRSTVGNLAAFRQRCTTQFTSLYSNRSLPESFLHENAQRRTIGPAGKHFVNSTPSIRSYSNSKTPSRCFKSLPPVTELAKLHPVATPSALAQWKTPYARWARGSPVWGARISGKRSMVTSTSV
jgi:hypothetical protein